MLYRTHRVAKVRVASVHKKQQEMAFTNLRKQEKEFPFVWHKA